MLQPYAQHSLVAKRNNTGALMSAYYIGVPPTFAPYVNVCIRCKCACYPFFKKRRILPETEEFRLGHEMMLA